MKHLSVLTPRRSGKLGAGACSTCRYHTLYVSWWCTNSAASTKHRTAFPEVANKNEDCRYWLPLPSDNQSGRIS